MHVVVLRNAPTRPLSLAQLTKAHHCPLCAPCIAVAPADPGPAPKRLEASAAEDSAGMLEDAEEAQHADEAKEEENKVFNQPK